MSELPTAAISRVVVDGAGFWPTMRSPSAAAAMFGAADVETVRFENRFERIVGLLPVAPMFLPAPFWRVGERLRHRAEGGNEHHEANRECVTFRSPAL
ncbi:hypothetical protein R5W24_000589 [Gemmata sp. JC717]|uniref:hypothetical protein n=1 Tax=Gemmata algarum TaxID=2975278 RepID=UPI0021BA4888|nr:hypothetical protein [Gemmata algarum]MDY3551511.1 hypothetical protein [Gemmata algarum]